jgi:3-oxoacyl-(acyl-carrier-protein) synthase
MARPAAVDHFYSISAAATAADAFGVFYPVATTTTAAAAATTAVVTAFLCIMPPENNV